jgi:ceramide glucosyltransferase
MLAGDFPLSPLESVASLVMITLLYYALVFLLAVASLGGIAYYLIGVAAARKRIKNPTPFSTEKRPLPPISLLKPLNGADPGLEGFLESYFQQDYPSFEILFAVRHESDPSVAILRPLMERYSNIPTRLIFTGEPPYANAKVYSMEKMAELASHSILVITDSDASVEPDYLRAIARDFEPEDVGAVTNLYRGVSGSEFWSKLEALGMSTEFMAGVVVADRLEGMKFAVGVGMAIRADCLKAIGGFAAMADYLADDFVLGKWAFEAGYRVVLSDHVINHHTSSTGFINTFKHRLRWNRSSRFSRPAGYIGQGFIYGLPWAIALFVAAPTLWSAGILIFSMAARLCLAYELGVRLLGDRKALVRFWLIPLQDIISFATWVGGFIGREIIWRNERYQLLEGGRFVPVAPRRI